MGRLKRNLKTTLLFVGEGDADKAFLSHLKSLYACGDLKITCKSAGGKGPNNVINDAISTFAHGGYDKAAVLLDTDIPWPNPIVKKATSKKIALIGSDPCLEGLLLDILGQKKGKDSKHCKDLLHKQLSGRATDKKSYEILFTHAALEKARQHTPPLQSLINIIQNKP